MAYHYDTNITIRLTNEDKAEYKAFFASQNVSLTFGIKTAIEFLMQEVKAGKGKIKNTGYYPNIVPKTKKGGTK